MTETIKQRHEKDCFLCCLAMAAGLTYGEAAEKWGPDFVARVAENGCYDKDVITAFEALGLVREQHYRALFIMPEYASVGFLKNVLWGRRACVQVRSKNHAGEMHIVYWDGAALHDPSNKRTWLWDEVEPIYLWLFDERGEAA